MIRKQEENKNIPAFQNDISDSRSSVDFQFGDIYN